MPEDIKQATPSADASPQERIVYLFNEGKKTHRIQLYATAIDFYTQAIQLNDQLPALYDARALSYRASDNPNRALADLNRALALNQEYLPAYVNRGNLFIAKQQYQQAISDYNAFLDKTTNSEQRWRVLHNRGLAFAKLGQHRQAIDDYTEVIGHAPQYATVYFNRGVAYTKQQRAKEAINDLQIFLQKNQEGADSLVLKARTLIFQLGGRPRN